MKIARRENPAAAPWDGHRLFHCSPAVYDVPCMIEAEKHVLANDKHPNGVLGLWLSNVPEMCIGFGPYVYETEIAPDARIGIVPYSELFGWHRFTNQIDTHSKQVEWYKAKRLELLESIDVFYVDDNRPSSDVLGEIVVVNLNVITKHERTESWQRKNQNSRAATPALTGSVTY